MVRMHNKPFSQSVRVRAAALLAALALALAGPVTSGYAQDPVYDVDVGLLYVNSFSSQRPHCVGSTAKMNFQVVYYNLPDTPMEKEATVLVTASDGTEYQANTTWPGSYAAIEYPLSSEGTMQFSATATVLGNVSPPVTFSLEVVQCQWRFTVSFDEEYDLSEDKSLKIKSDGFVWGDLKRELMDLGGSTDIITLGNSLGNYFFHVTDTMEALDAYLDPDLIERINVELHDGYTGGGTMHLTFISSAEGLPEMVNIGFKDVTEQANEIYVTAPVPTCLSCMSIFAERGFDPMEMMTFRSITLPETGGVIETNPDKIFIQSPNQISSFATFTLSVSHSQDGSSE